MGLPMLKYILTFTLLLLIMTAAFLGFFKSEDSAVDNAFYPFSQSDDLTIAGMVSSLWVGDEFRHEIPGQFESTQSTVYLAARRRGRKLADQWSAEGKTLDSLRSAISLLKAKIADQRKIAAVDTLELVFAYDFEKVNSRKRHWSANIHRGVRGIEFRYQDVAEKYGPTYMLATNRSPTKLRQMFQTRYKIRKDAEKDKVEIQTFAADQWLINLRALPDGQPDAVKLERGNIFVPIEAVTEENTQETARLAKDWLANNLHPDGRMTYKFWPSPNQESTGNNMIRQWMATVALVRAAQHFKDEKLLNRAAANIDYNLSQFYRTDKELGLIYWNSKVKLGAVALAALALAEHPWRSRWQEEELALQRTIQYLWKPDGAFLTFYKPAFRNDVQNFYPGEALLYWATLYEGTGDEKLLEQIMSSFRYYRKWHLDPANRNPAFIPWHTQAYYKVWKLTANEELKHFIFQMNDWLVDEMQQWEGEVRYRDALGRFYNAKRPYGPPHVSSTGVYLEGLIDAYLLASTTKDENRELVYKTAIQRGIRSVMQLQFVDDTDMYYVPLAQRDRVRGGMRTTLYNNEIRCDNVQHNLMAMLKILAGFKTGDYLYQPTH